MEKRELLTEYCNDRDSCSDGYDGCPIKELKPGNCNFTNEQEWYDKKINKAYALIPREFFITCYGREELEKFPKGNPFLDKELPTNYTIR